MTNNSNTTGIVTIRKMNEATIWYLNDRKHRIDGPAIEYDDGGVEWYKDGLLHREDGPAINYVSGYKAWWLNGQIHRVDGPAVEFSNGRLGWYINGKDVTSEVNEWLGLQNITLPMNNYELLFFILTFVGEGS